MSDLLVTHLFAALVLVLSACSSDPPPPDPNFAVASNGWYRGDLHYHSTHSEDAESQAGDDVATCLAIADAYRAPAFVEAYPELAGNGLDFIAITDHRTDAVLSDPDFKHDHLILIPAEEYGGAGHANIFGLKQHIPHEATPPQSQNDHHLAAIETAHAQGAIFSINHPAGGSNWVWDTPTIDAVEVFNNPWAGFMSSSSLEELEQDLEQAGVENPYIRSAFEAAEGTNERALRFWQNMLTDGRHVPLVGGSDRHMLLPAAIPTTYVRIVQAGSQAKPGYEAIVSGIKAGGTFVSRSPFGPQIDQTARGPDGKSYPLGSRLPRPGTWTIVTRVSRAPGGQLRLMAGALRQPSGGRVTAEPEVVHRVEIGDATVFETSFSWDVGPAGGWLHAVVLEPLTPQALPRELEAVYDLVRTPMTGKAELALAVNVLLPLIGDSGVVFNPASCDPGSWKPWQLQCMPADKTPLATFYIPDGINRLLNIYYEDNKATDWCMGAVSSAFLVDPAKGDGSR